MVEPGASLRIVMVNGDGIPHDLVIDELKARTTIVSQKGGQDELVVEALSGEGTYDYYCSVPGHRQLGMEGKLVVEESD
jgi:nitrite reductase (NO-forming)